MHGDGGILEKSPVREMTGGPSKWHMGAAGARGWPAAATAGLPRVPQILFVSCYTTELRKMGGCCFLLIPI
jgi:hypothetical protein